VNKTFSLPKDYAPGISPEAEQAFYAMAAAAWTNYGVSLWQNSGYRSYEEQEAKYNEYAAERGLEEADKVSARPGHSEHQTGLCYDINSTEFSFADTFEAQWLDEHCAEYGFIVRFPKGKEMITGYEYEPWHLRYVGVELAQTIHSQGLCLEEYLNVTSNYENSPDNEAFLKSHEQFMENKPDENAAAGQAGNGYGD
jgi:D-alanyl-D-alanine carboxypeptidase